MSTIFRLLYYCVFTLASTDYPSCLVTRRRWFDEKYKMTRSKNISHFSVPPLSFSFQCTQHTVLFIFVIISYIFTQFLDPSSSTHAMTLVPYVQPHIQCTGPWQKSTSSTAYTKFIFSHLSLLFSSNSTLLIIFASVWSRRQANALNIFHFSFVCV